ncbi:MAG: hypothetical protein JNL44_12790 [Gemmatimonadetes bacterium]|nr:hypothetical protein [Gemmatimonadota bacterium]
MSQDFVASLLANQAFKRDLPELAQLSDSTLEAVLALLLEEGDFRHPAIDARFARISASHGVAQRTVAGVWSLGSILVDSTENAEGELRKLVDGIREIALETESDTTALATFLTNVVASRAVITERRERRSLVAEGGRTVGAVSIVTDLRVRSKSAKDGAILAGDYSPRPIELIPLVIVKLSFASPDDGDDCVFQLLPGELDDVVSALQAAKKDVDAASRMVTIRSETEQ